MSNIFYFYCAYEEVAKKIVYNFLSRQESSQRHMNSNVFYFLPLIHSLEGKK